MSVDRTLLQFGATDERGLGHFDVHAGGALSCQGGAGYGNSSEKKGVTYDLWPMCRKTSRNISLMRCDEALGAVCNTDATAEVFV